MIIADAPNDEILFIIHKAIHNREQTSVQIEDETFPINENEHQCRYIDYKGVRYIEQRKDKSSRYAKRANAGHLITWGMRPGKWTQIEDENIVFRNPNPMAY